MVGNKAGSLEVEAAWPGLPHPVSTTYKEVETFEGDGLNINFQTLRIPFTDTIGSLKESPGHLRLYGRESLTSLFTQSFVARRWQSLNFEAETALKYTPENFQQAAGLVNYYNTENWTALQVSFNEEKGRVLELTSCDNFGFSAHLEDAKVEVLEVNIFT